MTILENLNTLLADIGAPIETGSFSGKAPSEYIVIVPMTDTFHLHADNTPNAEVQDARLSIFTQGNYKKLKNSIVKALLSDDFTITDRRYIGLETDTGYHHYVVDIEKNYELED